MASASSPFTTSPASQSGAVLLFSLLLMVVITALALGANHMMGARTSSIARLQLQDAAFRSAEDALSAGERVVSTSLSPPPVCAGRECPVFAPNVLDMSAADDREWWEAKGSRFGGQSLRGNKLAGAWFVVEEIARHLESPTNNDSEQLVVFYRVTAASADLERVKVILQSTYARSFRTESDESSQSGFKHASSRQSWRQIR